MSISASASADPQRVFDPTKPGKYTVQLGKSLTGQSASEDTYSSVVFNHKPSQTGTKRKTTIKQSSRTGTPFELLIDDEEDNEEETRQCKYAGRLRDLPESYILVFDREKQTFELEVLSSAYEFNMVSAPWEKDETMIAQQYKQIYTNEGAASPVEVPAGSGTEDEGSGAESEGPKASNPFDYRHYLNGIPSTTGTDSKQPSNFSSPLLPPKRAPVEPSSQSTRAQNNTPIRAPQARAPVQPSQASKIKIQDRKSKPSERRKKTLERETESHLELVNSEDDDAGGLIIDDDSRPATKKRRGGAVPKGGKPMSLHAAAQAAKAARESQQPSPREQDGGSGYEEDDEEDGHRGADDDVEDLELSEPVIRQPDRPDLTRRDSAWVDGDEEMLVTLMDQEYESENNEELNRPVAASGDGANSRPVESESESEEE